MDITLIGRNVGITDRFRSYAMEKTEKVEHLADRALALEIRLCRHHETHGTAGDDRVEMTLIGPGPVVRAEAGGADKFAAFDAALAKLVERIRRAKDRKKPHHGHGNRMPSLRGADTTPAAGADFLENSLESTFDASSLAAGADGVDRDGASPVVLRHKRFTADPISVDDALYRMELVGHDFYLFVDMATGLPSVVYKRVGWNYGVIALGGDGAEARSAESVGVAAR